MKVMNNIIYSIYSPGCKQLDLNFDKIVKLEKFDTDMENVTKVLNLPNVIDFKNFYHQPPSPISKNTNFVYDTKPLDFLHDELPSYEYFYNDELKDLVNDISFRY